MRCTAAVGDQQDRARAVDLSFAASTSPSTAFHGRLGCNHHVFRTVPSRAARRSLTWRGCPKRHGADGIDRRPRPTAQRGSSSLRALEDMSACIPECDVASRWQNKMFPMRRWRGAWPLPSAGLQPTRSFAGARTGASESRPGVHAASNRLQPASGGQPHARIGKLPLDGTDYFIACLDFEVRHAQGTSRRRR